MRDPGLAAVARTCFAIALDSLRRTGADAALAERVADWSARHVDAGRSPADHRLDHWQRTGSTALPPADT
jgi:glutamate--cysteine ligase